MIKASIGAVKKSSVPIAIDVTIVYNDMGVGSADGKNGNADTARPILNDKYSRYSVSTEADTVGMTLLRTEWEEYGFRVGDPIEDSDIDELTVSAEVCAAVFKGLRLLGYSDSSVKGLADKLRRRGIARDVATRAAEAIETAGYINEKAQIERRGRMLSEQKLRGRRRVADELYAAGYRREAISEWAAENDIDYAVICARAIEKRGGVPTAPDEKRKLLQYLYRQGFSSDDVRGAVRILSDK